VEVTKAQLTKAQVDAESLAARKDAAIIMTPNICTIHAHTHSRATLLPDSDIFLSMTPVPSCLSIHVQSDRSRDEKGRWLAGKRTYHVWKLVAHPCFGTLKIQ